MKGRHHMGNLRLGRSILNWTLKKQNARLVNGFNLFEIRYSKQQWIFGFRNTQEKFSKFYITVHSQHNTAKMIWKLLCFYVCTILKFLQNSELKKWISLSPTNHYLWVGGSQKITAYHITHCQSFPRNMVQMITSLFNGLAKTECLVIFSITRHHTKWLLCSWEFVGDKAFQAGLPDTVNDLKDTIAGHRSLPPWRVTSRVGREGIRRGKLTNQSLRATMPRSCQYYSNY